jgi:hypothetical protein
MRWQASETAAKLCHSSRAEAVAGLTQGGKAWQATLNTVPNRIAAMQTEAATQKLQARLR